VVYLKKSLTVLFFYFALENIFLLFCQQVKIWEERKATPLAVLRPHDGKPVNSVTFLTAPHRPDHIVLVTAVYAPSF
jgi:hypothetical protein